MENLNASSETMFKINNQIVCKNKKRPSFYTSQKLGLSITQSKQN